MDAEKNVVEAARNVLANVSKFLKNPFCVRINQAKVDSLRSALSAYDSAPAPSEDRVREAVRAVFDAIHGEPNVYFPPPDVYARCADALKPYVTPAPALPAGTVVARLEWLRLMLTVAKQRDCTEIVDEIEGFLEKLPRPEPPKELELKWHNAGCLLANKRGYSSFNAPGAQDFVNGYVAALRAAWEAKGGA